MKAGDCMWMPREEGEGAGTKEPGDGTCSWGLPGDPAASNAPGDGVLMYVEGDGAIPWKHRMRAITTNLMQV